MEKASVDEPLPHGQAITAPTLWQAIKSNLHAVLFTIAAGYAGKSYQMIDQAFAARISADHLKAHVMIAYVPFLTTFFAMVLGYSLLVLIGKADGEHEKRDLYSGALAASLCLGAVVSILCGVPARALTIVGGIAAVPGSTAYLVIQSGVSFLLPANTIAKYLCIATRRSHLFLIGDGCGTLLNAFGNYVAMHSFSTQAEQFEGLAVATLVVQVALFIFYHLALRTYVRFDLRALASYWQRARQLVLGQSLDIMLFALVPLVYTLLYRLFGTADLVSAYNVGYHLVSFISVPLYAISATGTAWLAESWKIGDIGVWRLRMRAIRWTAVTLVGLPVVILVPLVPWILSSVFGIPGQLEVWVTRILLLAIIAPSITLAQACGIRVFETPILLARSDFIGSYLIGMPLFALLTAQGNVKIAIIAASLSSVVVSSSFIAYFMARIQRSQAVFK
jgi:O-antigen/teichoic acid export membrane protein